MPRRRAKKKNREKSNRDLEKQYYDTRHEAGYSGARNLLHINSRGKKLGKAERAHILDWLDAQDAYSLHRTVKRRFPRLRYTVSFIDDVWETDLLQLTNLKSFNDDFSYIMIVIDVLSKYLWVEAMRDKTMTTAASAFKKILSRSGGRICVLLQSDQGCEFTGSSFQKMLKKHGIHFRFTRDPVTKACVVERVIRTLRERIWRYLTHKNTKRYIDVLQNVVSAYNKSVHSGTKLKPSEVDAYNKNLIARHRSQTVNARGAQLKNNVKYSVGRHVRVSRLKSTFERGYEQNFSQEIFRVKRISKRQGIFTYFLEDLNGEDIDGFFYAQELAPVATSRVENGTFQIDKVIKVRGQGAKREALVSWKGWPKSFHSWVKYSEIKNI